MVSAGFKKIPWVSLVLSPSTFIKNKLTHLQLMFASPFFQWWSAGPWIFSPGSHLLRKYIDIRRFPQFKPLPIQSVLCPHKFCNIFIIENCYFSSERASGELELKLGAADWNCNCSSLKKMWCDFFLSRCRLQCSIFPPWLLSIFIGIFLFFFLGVTTVAPLTKKKMKKGK